jgi:CRP/FNR family transcriptional regulator, dissimilatory nitrate respiration regulator
MIRVMCLLIDPGLRGRMELCNVRSARERVLQYLRLRTGTNDRSISIEGRLQDIAAEIGMTREALYGVLGASRSRSINHPHGYDSRTQQI